MRILRCPSWCVGHTVLPEDPLDGLMHYGPPAVLELSCSARSDVPDVLTVRLAAWSQTAEDCPGPAHLDVTISDHPGFDLSPREARKLAAVLESQSVQADM
ncbi:hypothetical protein ABIA39_003480 [Nocardia sp. GAS34]|uniref:DUF6907 domain-containing protein n=1 Tax=unclassified Nocardia TaxID=2637762 RepID=UPI003D19C716